MIKNVYANGPFLRAETTGVSYSTPYINVGTPSAGIIRYNNQQLEVYDGSSWQPIGGNGQVMLSLDHHAERAIMWAQEKMQQERDLKELADRHPAIEDAVNKLKDAEDELKVITALIQKQGNK